jgi:KUP system potassium uptake protein
LGQFSKGAIRLSFTSVVYPALILAYLGQGAALITRGPDVVTNIFYRSIPGGQGGALWWITWIFALLAAIVASQAMITGGFLLKDVKAYLLKLTRRIMQHLPPTTIASFSLIQQMVGLKSFPPVRIIHTSDSSRGQIYAPVVNFLLLIGTVGVTAGFGADEGLNSACMLKALLIASLYPRL